MLTVHRSEWPEALVAGLAEVLARPPADPFTAEVVAVPARGVERWLTHQLALVLGAGTAGTGTSTDGIAAGIQFPSPAAVLATCLAEGAGLGVADDPWHVDRLRWTVLGVLDSCAGEPWCAVLGAHLGHGENDHRRGRRYATAAHLAGLFASYAENRPAVLADWAAGRLGDGAGGELAADQHWQAELWRRVSAAAGGPDPATRLAQVCARLRAEPGCVDLPERLSVFGATQLSSAVRTVLGALAEHRQVDLWLPTPSLAAANAAAATPVTRRRADRTADLVGHPLLATLGRDSRELAQLLAGSPVREHPGPPPDRPSGPTTLLHRLQAGIRAGTPVAAGPDAGSRAGPDSSVSVHACHGPARQVEVLREAVLGILADDPTLEPRDVLVMCPDIETFAPLLRAVFETATPARPSHPGQLLRVRLADRAPGRANPVLDVVARVLALGDGRALASEVLDLAACPPVRRRFGFDDDALGRIAGWVRDTGVRWGLGERQRAAFRVGSVPHGTWRTGLDRLLVGVTADETGPRWLGTALPLDDVDSSDVVLAGSLAEFVDLLGAAVDRMSGEYPAAEWSAVLTAVVHELCAVGFTETWQAEAALAELTEAFHRADDETSLGLPDVRSLLAGRLGGRATRANFRTGDLTVATMVPMRWVPHRVLVLLGLDEGSFPRVGTPDGDDVLARDPCVGERDPRSEDRQLLLDAVLAARTHLVVVYGGADPVSGARRPPPAPLAEVVDVLTALAGVDLTVRHPLQPFAAANFEAGRLGRPGQPFSFDVLAAAGAAGGSPGAPGPATAVLPVLGLGPPTPPMDGPVRLADLVSLLENPARGFLRQRLGVVIPDDAKEQADDLGAELDGLAAWQVGERILQARLAGADAAAVRAAELRRGDLPPFAFGTEALNLIEARVAGVLELLAKAELGGPLRALPVAHPAVVGTVRGQLQPTPVVVAVTYSRTAAKHLILPWLGVLSGAADQAVVAGRGAQLRALGYRIARPPAPGAQLEALVGIYRAGLLEPLPVTPETGLAYARAAQDGATHSEALERARAAGAGSFGSDRWVAHALGPFAGWDHGRFAELARAIYLPLLDARELL